MNSTILLVDDEPSVLRGYLRNLGDMFVCETASNAAEALLKLAEADKYALLMTDYRMPGLTGVELLRKAQALRPNMTRMLITGYADVKISMEAINEGSVFRMLTKPCETQSFYRAIEDGLRQHELVMGEKELLDQTLKGVVHMLGDIISVLDHKSFGRCQKLAAAAREVAVVMGVEKLWEVEVAATLAEVGRATLPNAVARMEIDAVDITEAEKSLLTNLPEFSSHLLTNIPRLEQVTSAILYQNKNFDGTGFPHDGLRGEYIPLTARIFRVVNELLNETENDKEIKDIIHNMEAAPLKFDPAVVAACHKILPQLEKIIWHEHADSPKQHVWLKDLREGMRLVSNIETRNGVLIIAAGSVIRATILQRIKNFAAIMPIREPIQVSGY